MVNAEWQKAKEILISEPSTELFKGVLDFNLSFYQSVFDTEKAIEEHKQFNKILKEEYGVKIIELDKALMKDRGSLEKIAYQNFNYKKINNGIILEDEEKIFNEKIYKTIKEICLKDLVKIVLQRPTLFIKKQGSQFYIDHFETRPVMNHYFQRDTQITTGLGSVICSMKEEVRKYEVEIVEQAMKNIGKNPIYKVSGKGVLEGGDYFPAGEFALIGCGLRTNLTGINQLLDNNVIGFNEVAVVKDEFCSQCEMHLDTYFNIVGEGKGIILEDRLNNGPNYKNVLVSVFKKEGNHYFQQNDFEEKLTLEDYLKNKGFSLLSLTKEQQKNYGLNVLCMDNNQIVAVRDVPGDYLKQMKNYGVNVREINLDNLKKGYGGPHCMTQVLKRE